MWCAQPAHVPCRSSWWDGWLEGGARRYRFGVVDGASCARPGLVSAYHWQSLQRQHLHACSQSRWCPSISCVVRCAPHHSWTQCVRLARVSKRLPCRAQTASTYPVIGWLDLVRPGVNRQVCIKVLGLLLGRQVQAVGPQAALGSLLDAVISLSRRDLQGMIVTAGQHTALSCAHHCSCQTPIPKAVIAVPVFGSDGESCNCARQGSTCARRSCYRMQGRSTCGRTDAAVRAAAGPGDGALSTPLWLTRDCCVTSSGAAELASLLTSSMSGVHVRRSGEARSKSLQAWHRFIQLSATTS